VLGAQVAVERDGGADAVAVEHIHDPEHADTIAVVALGPHHHVGNLAGAVAAGPLLQEKYSMLGMTHSATWAPPGHSRRGRWMIGE